MGKSRARRLIVADRVVAHSFGEAGTLQDARRRVECVVNGRKDVVAVVVGRA